VELARSLGADHVIDYTLEDFTLNGKRYDVVYDNAGSRSFSELRRVMNKNSTLVPAGVRPGGKWLGPFPHLLSVFVARLFASQKVVFFVASISPGDLKAISGMIEAGKVRPTIERTYSFAETPAALRYVKEGHARAKVVVTVA
jgi:NADPH:quinone reductase-like Zn-dependent oxidoreductase